MDPSDLRAAKQALRAEVRLRRRERPAAAREAAASAIGHGLRHLTDHLGASTVACYLSRPDEPGTAAYLAWAARAGVRVLLPVALPGGLLDWVEQRPGATIETGALGVPQPTGPRLGGAALDAADLVIVPAAALDDDGGRLGWGRGYYDRALAAARAGRLRPTWGVVFDDELVAAVPRERHDIGVDGAVTPTRTTVLPVRPAP